jgi:hypothetical protein
LISLAVPGYVKNWEVLGSVISSTVAGKLTSITCWYVECEILNDIGDI